MSSEPESSVATATPDPETPATRPSRARGSRRAASGSAGPGGESQQQITVSVGELGSSTKSVTGASGMTVGQALERAGVRTEGRATLIRGARVTRETVLEDHDVLVVSGRVRGGAI